MDQRRFDDLTRLLGTSGTRRGGLRAALGGLLGLTAGAAALEADAKGRGKDRDRAGAARRKHECGPDAPCPTGFDCVKQGRKRRCSCASGVLCAGGCCPAGQVCQNGSCVEPVSCVAPGQQCKGVGVPCCAGRVCASGQGGETDVACYLPKTAACEATGDCVYGTTCVEGRCTPPLPEPPQVIQGLGTACDAARGDTCAVPDAECIAYDGPDAPDGEPGDYCTLPLNKVCTGDPDCTCYHCWYENPAVGGTSRAGDPRTVSTRLACCGPAGYTCKTDRNCCLGALCVNGVCQSETTCDVCSSGCPFTSIKAAYDDVGRFPAGSTIRIASGEYVEDSVILTRDITFRRCGDSGTVTWRNRTNSSSYLLSMPGNINDPRPSSVDLAFIDFTMTPGQLMAFLTSFAGKSSQRLTLNALGCTWRDLDNTSGGNSAADLGSYVDATFTACTFRNNKAKNNNNGAGLRSSGDTVVATRNNVSLNRCTFTGNSGGNGGAVWISGTAMTATDSIFSGNTAALGGGAIFEERQGSSPGAVSLHNCLVTGNTAGDNSTYAGGGGVQVCTKCTLSVSGTTTISGNHAGTFGSGIMVSVSAGETAFYAPNRVSGTTSGNVSGNTVQPDCQIFSYYSPRTRFAVTCDGWCVPKGGVCRGDTAACCDGSVCVNSNGNDPATEGTCP